MDSTNAHPVMLFSCGCDVSLSTTSGITAILVSLELFVYLGAAKQDWDDSFAGLQRGPVSFVWYLPCTDPAKFDRDISKSTKVKIGRYCLHNGHVPHAHTNVLSSRYPSATESSVSRDILVIFLCNVTLRRHIATENGSVTSVKLRAAFQDRAVMFSCVAEPESCY